MSVEWLAAARADLARIFEFNASRSPAYAERVEARLIERADALERTPGMGRPVGKSGLKLLSVVDIQYVVTYARLGETVTIFRVRHAREIKEA